MEKEETGESWIFIKSRKIQIKNLELNKNIKRIRRRQKRRQMLSSST